MKALVLAMTLVSMSAFAIEISVPQSSTVSLDIYTAKKELDNSISLMDYNGKKRLSYDGSGGSYYYISYFNSVGVLINKTTGSYDQKKLLEIMINSASTICPLTISIDSTSIHPDRDLNVKSIKAGCDVFAQGEIEDNQA